MDQSGSRWRSKIGALANRVVETDAVKATAAGYRLFLDGALAGELTGSSMTANRTGNIQVV